MAKKKTVIENCRVKIDKIDQQIIDLLDNDVARHAMRKKAYVFSRDAVWKEVSNQYLQLFNDVQLNRDTNPRPRHAYVAHIKAITAFELPEIKLDHLKTLTDDTGILQHANHTIPDRSHGYCTDDNARALLAAAILGNKHPAFRERLEAFRARQTEQVLGLVEALNRHAYGWQLKPIVLSHHEVLAPVADKLHQMGEERWTCLFCKRTMIAKAAELAPQYRVQALIMGDSLGLSPLVVMFALLFFGWMWGIWGMVLSVPLAAIIKIICENFESTRPMAVFME